MTDVGGAFGSAAGSTFAGPADLVASGGGGVSNWTFWGSCARGYSNAKAAANAAVCDVVDTSTGLVTCTFHLQSTGFVNPAECNATACAVACRLTKLYDQSGSGNDMTQATLANMPDIDLSGGLAGLPAFSCVGRGGGSCSVVTSTTFSGNTPPRNYLMVYKSANTGAFSGIVGIDNGTISLGISTTADNMRMFDGAAGVNAGAVATSFHVGQGQITSAAGGTYLARADAGGDQTNTAAVNNFPASAHLRCHRADGGATQDVAILMECAMLVDQSTTLTSQNRTDLNTNAHSATNGYNF
jgi:hypothetical protein